MSVINTDIILSNKTLLFKHTESSEYIFYDFNNSNNQIVSGFVSFDTASNTFSCTHIISRIDWRDVVTFIYSRIPALTDLLSVEEDAVSYLLNHFTFDAEQPVEYIKDKDLINYTLFKGTFIDEDLDLNLTLWLRVYYRSTGNSIFTFPNNTDDTLVFSAIDFYQHPSYLTYLRNIASPNPLVPDIFQTLYTETNRPDGTISTLNEYIFVQGLSSTDNYEYFINFVYPNTAYRFIPYFILNPAHYDINASSGSAGWAYCFEVISTSSAGYGSTNINDANTYKSGWLKYEGSTIAPTYLLSHITSFTGIDSTQSTNINATNILNRHFRGTRYVIYVVPSELSPQSTINSSDGDCAFTDWNEVFTPPEFGPQARAFYANEGAKLLSKLSPIKTIEDLRKLLLDTYSTNKFYLLDLQGTTSLHNVPTGVKEIDHTRTFKKMLPTFNSSDHTVTTIAQFTGITNTDEAAESFYSGYFKTGEEILTLLNNGEAFKDYDISFKLIPYVNCVFKTVGETVYANYILREYKEFDNAQERSYVHRYFTRGFSLSKSIFYDYTNIDINGNRGYLVNFNPYKLIKEFPELSTKYKFFINGYTIIFYLAPYTAAELDSIEYKDIGILEQTLATRAYKQTRSVNYGYDALSVQTVDLVDTYNSNAILNAQNYIVYNQDRLVVWNKNNLYISEAGNFYYFKESGKQEFSEKIVKAIQFKNTILVFTVQHLYALAETEIQLPTGTTNADGTVGTSSSVSWVKQTVLYNILTDSKYVDAIKVFNQMVLFYSSDGQLFFIKPSTQIDDQTRFSLQYFNKSANDILQNYDVYINERLMQYGRTETVTKDDVNIKVNVTVNNIYIFYCVPNVITYCLVYDVLNNRYSAWDTLSFTNIKNIYYSTNGYIYKTIENDHTYFSMQRRLINSVDNNFDVSYHLGFKPQSIQCLVDTGNLNINNHLLKRFRDLNVTFKNINATEITFDFSFIVDGITIKPFYENVLQVKTIGGSSYLNTTPSSSSVQLLQEQLKNTILGSAPDDMRVNETRNVYIADYTSEKILTQRSSVVTTGKILRMILQFNAKGTYKILGYGVIYKERRI